MVSAKENYTLAMCFLGKLRQLCLQQYSTLPFISWALGMENHVVGEQRSHCGRVLCLAAQFFWIDEWEREALEPMRDTLCSDPEHS